MNKLFFLLLFAGMANAQIMIPDANFKARLLAANETNQYAYGEGGYIKVDVNENGEIELIEAQAVDSLNVYNAGIVDMTGIASFTGLKKLDCTYNEITTLDVSALSQLQYLSCADNNLASLNISGLTNLTYLNLQFNALSELDVAEFTNLVFLSCYGNQISQLDLATLTNLEYLDCGSNQLTTLDVTTLVNLTTLGCATNNISSIDLSNLSNLTFLSIGNAELFPIDFSGVTALSQLMIYEYPESEIDLTLLPNLIGLSIFNSNMTILDLSDKPALNILQLYDIVPLETLFIKNGGSVSSVIVMNCPNLVFVCANAVDLSNVSNALVNEGNNPDVVVNSYCTFTPGGDYNTIVGTFKFDGDNNGCDSGDGTFSNIRIDIIDANDETGSTFTTAGGNFIFYTEAGTFDLTPSIEHPEWFAFSPSTATVSFADDNNNTATQDFCLTANGVHPDVEVYIFSGPARPGFDSMYYIGYTNRGNQIVSGNINVSYDDAVLDYVSATTAPNSQSTGSLTWDYSNLMPFESRYYNVTLNVNSTLETPPVNSGDVLTITAFVTTTIGDDIPANNQYAYLQPVVNSCDPNDKYCMEGEVVSPDEIGNYLHYQINFENIGTATAVNVVVEDLIDEAKFDISTLQILGTSHPVDARINGNLATFIFQGINLEIGGHGNILLKIKTRDDLMVGDEAINQANIFFDYNAPIETNEARTLFQLLDVADPNYDASIAIYPNPVRDNIYVKASTEIQSVQLFDVQGRLLQTAIVNDSNTSIDISGKQSGVYFLKVTSLHGIRTEKIVKQ